MRILTLLRVGVLCPCEVASVLNTTVGRTKVLLDKLTHCGIVSRGPAPLACGYGISLPLTDLLDHLISHFGATPSFTTMVYADQSELSLALEHLKYSKCHRWRSDIEFRMLQNACRHFAHEAIPPVPAGALPSLKQTA